VAPAQPLKVRQVIVGTVVVNVIEQKVPATIRTDLGAHMTLHYVQVLANVATLFLR
jgi:hypothetical protein